MRCSLGAVLEEATASQREIAQMVLEDREGFTNVLDLGIALVTLLTDANDAAGDITLGDITDHRHGDCVCTDIRPVA